MEQFEILIKLAMVPWFDTYQKIIHQVWKKKVYGLLTKWKWAEENMMKSIVTIALLLFIADLIVDGWTDQWIGDEGWMDGNDDDGRE